MQRGPNQKCVTLKLHLYLKCTNIQNPSYGLSTSVLSDFEELLNGPFSNTKKQKMKASVIMNMIIWRAGAVVLLLSQN